MHAVERKQGRVSRPRDDRVLLLDSRTDSAGVDAFVTALVLAASPGSVSALGAHPIELSEDESRRIAELAGDDLDVRVALSFWTP
jgi:hypothetical protein